MCYKKNVSYVLIFCLLSGCASNYQNTIANKKNELKNIDAPNASKLLGGDRDIVFTIEHANINIDYALPKLEKDNIAKITKQNQGSQENRQVGCIRIDEKSFAQCPYSFQSNIFLKDKVADPGHIIVGTVFLPLNAVFEPQNIKENYVRTTIDSEAIQSVGEIINKTIYLELQGVEQSKDTKKMEQFLTKYAVTDKKSSPYQKLISLYRYQNNFDSYLKAFEITGEKDDLRQAYNVATTDYQKKKIEDIAEELQRRERASQAAALAGVALGVMAVKWLFGAIGSAMSAGSSSGSSSAVDSSSNSSSCGVTDTCYVLIRHEESAAYVQCIKGPSIGKEMCLSYKATTGKYASGCGVSDAFAHHYKLEEAGNIACR